MKLENLIIDPSFFVKPEKLSKISKLEKSIAEFELIKQSQSGAGRVRQGMKVSMGSELQTFTSRSGSGSSKGYSVSFSEEELSKHKPKIILPNILKIIDPLSIRKENLTVDHLADDYVLRDIFKHWGLKKEIIRNEEAYREFIHQLTSSRLVAKFFNERRERITWLKDPKEDDKIGENSIHYRDLQKIQAWPRDVSKTLFQMLKRCNRAPNTCIAYCNNGFHKLTKKVGITRIKLFASGSVATTSAVKLCHFSLGLDPVVFLQTLDIAPDLITAVIDTALAASIGFPVLSLVTNSARFASTWKKEKKEFKRRFTDDGGYAEHIWNLKPKYMPQFL